MGHSTPSGAATLVPSPQAGGTGREAELLLDEREPARDHRRVFDGLPTKLATLRKQAATMSASRSPKMRMKSRS
jgi:hypothetical protein